MGDTPTQTDAPLTPEQIDALPVGQTIYDCDGDEVVRYTSGWIYTRELENLGPEDGLAGVLLDRPKLYAPYTLTPKAGTNA